MAKKALRSKTKTAKARAPGRKVKRRRSREHILNLIVKAAGDEFKRVGFAGATTEAIARKAGVTEAQVFRYFGSKTNLFRETIFIPIDRHLLNFIKEQRAAGREGKDISEENRRYTTELQRFLTEHAEMLTLLMVTQKYQAGGKGNIRPTSGLSAFFDHCVQAIDQRKTHNSKVDPRLTVRVAFASVLGNVMFKHWIFPAGQASDAEITDAVNYFILEGISANYDS